MGKTNNEPNDGLDSLPKNEKEETQKIIDEISAEESGDDSKKEDKDSDKKDDKESKEDKKSDGKDDKSDDDKDSDKKEDKSDDDKDSKKEDKKERRHIKLMPSFKYEMAKKDWEKEKKGLDDTIEKLKNSPPSKETVEKKDDKTEQVDLEKEAKRIAEKHNLEGGEGLIKDLMDVLAKFGGKVPAELAEQLKDLDNLKADLQKRTDDSDIATEETNFSTDFDKDILPLVKAEYGEDVSKEVISEVKELMKEKAYDDKFSKVELEVIYNGVKDFRNFKKPDNDSGGSGDGRQEIEGDGTDYNQMSKEEVEKLPPDEFKKWSDAQAASENKK